MAAGLASSARTEQPRSANYFARLLERRLHRRGVIPIGESVRPIRDVMQLVAAGRQIEHTVKGTIANGRFGPDLTHLMSRDTIAAGTLPNTRANLAKWIEDPNAYKPGSLMPAMKLSDQDLDQLVSYLVTLK